MFGSLSTRNLEEARFMTERRVTLDSTRPFRESLIFPAEKSLMTKLTRREWSKLALGSIAAATVFPADSIGAQKSKRVDSRFNGVQIGAQSYSFRDRPLDEMLKAMVEVGVGSCELWAGHLEPKKLSREELRRWRLDAPVGEIKAVREKFDRAGIDLYAFNYSMRDDFTDEELERGFVMARALGAKVMTSSSNVSTAKRIDTFARKHRMRVGMHNHSNLKNPNEFATPDSFMRAMEGTRNVVINLDIGHFTAANFDPVDFLRKHHDKIVTLHLKDRKRDQGDNMPFGEGDTPIKPVLALLRDNKWSIPANIEYEYKGADTIAEMKRCVEYCKQALTS